LLFTYLYDTPHIDSEAEGRDKQAFKCYNRQTILLLSLISQPKNTMKKTRKKIILILIICLLFLAIVAYFLNQRSQNQLNVSSQNKVDNQANEIIEVDEMLGGEEKEEEKEVGIT